MKKTTMKTKTPNSLVFRLGALVAATLMVLVPTTGMGNFATAAYAVPADQDTSLATFTIDGNAVTNGATVNADYGTSSVDVVATPTNVDATVDISGDTGLVTGPNTVSVVVTAADSTTTKTYSVTVDVASNGDASLGVFTVNGDDVVSGDTVNLPYGTTEVDVIAEPADVEATVVVTGGTDLVTGNNTLTVSVTAADGTVVNNTVTLVVSENGDASLGVYAVNGNDVNDGDIVELPYGTTEVDVIAEPADVEATVVVTGGTALATGPNTLTVSVTAADGTVVDHTVTLKVLANNDSSLANFAINGEDVVDGATVNVAKGTTSVTVIADASDPDAGVVIAGNENFTTGTNTLTVTVTAADGTTKTVYTVTVVVAGDEFSNDTSLSTFKVDGTTVSDGDEVVIAQGRTSVSVEAVPNNAYAFATVAGNTNLKAGDNNVTVTVTADDGTVKIYTVKVVVSTPSSDTTLSSVKINGNTFTGSLNGTGEYQAAFGTTAVTVVATPNSNAASVNVSGTSGLTTGNNLVTIHVTAETGATADYTFLVVVAAASTNTDLSTFKVNGTSVADNGIVNLDYGTTGVSVEVVTSSDSASYTVT